MSREFDDLTANLLSPEGRKKATSRMSLSGFLRRNRQSNYQVEDQRQVEDKVKSHSKPSKPLKRRVLSALGLRTPLKTDDIDNKIKELTNILEKYVRRGFNYINGKNNHNKIIANLQEQIAGYESYKDNITKATTKGTLEYILPDFEKLEKRLTVLQKMDELYNLKNWLNISYLNETQITTEKKKLVSKFVLERIDASITILKTSDNLDTFKEPISGDDYKILNKYLTTDKVKEIPLQILNDYELVLLFKNLQKLFSYSYIEETEEALLLVELNKILTLIKKNLSLKLADNILQFEELLELELLTDDILTIKDLNDILTEDDVKELKGLLENYEHSELKDLKDLQKLKELYVKKDKVLINMLKEVESDVSSGGRKASVKKEICGKLRCIYTIAGSRKEHVKYKGRLITVADYKRIHKIRKA